VRLVEAELERLLAELRCERNGGGELGAGGNGATALVGVRSRCCCAVRARRGEAEEWQVGRRRARTGVLKALRDRPVRHLPAVAGVRRPRNGRALTAIGHDACTLAGAGAGARCGLGRLRSWAEKGGYGPIKKRKCLFFLFFNHSAQKCYFEPFKSILKA
jgi:hypothetical protein